MAFVAVATSVGATVLGTGAAAGIGSTLVGGAILGAGAGALYSGITGDGDILNSALTGGLIGGAVGGIGGALFPSAAGYTAAPTLATTAGTTPALTAAKSAAIPEIASGTSAFGGSGAASMSPTAGYVAEVAPQTVANSTLLNTQMPSVMGEGVGLTSGAVDSALQEGLTGAGKTAVSSSMSPMSMLGYGLAGTTALSLLGGMNQKKLSGTNIPGQNPAMIRPFTYNVSQNQSAYPTTPQYGSNGLPILPTSEKSYFNQSYTAGTPYKAAAGGLMSVPTPGLMQSGPADVNFMGNDMYPTSQQHRSFYATPSQMPTSAQEVMASYEPKTNPLTGQMMKNMATGGSAEDNETPKERMKRIKDMNSMLKEIQESGRISMPDLEEYSPQTYVAREPSKLNVNALPQGFIENPQMKGVTGRVGANYAIDRDTQLMAGLSGFAGRDRGALAVKPETMDVGVARKVGPGFLSGQYQRSLTGQQAPSYQVGYAIPMADGGITYDAATQTYKGLPSAGGGPAVEIPILDAPPAAAAAQVNPDPFSMFGGFGPMAEIGMGEQAAPVGSDQFTPATSLYKNELGDLTSQWQAANPHAKSYNAANQTYGAGKPTNAQLLAIKNAQAQQAYNDRLSAYQGYAAGGGIESAYNLGSYSDGGRLLKGPGDGVSDDIPAVIGNKQPARLADGEFVIPARIVSEIGNGSTDAGAKRLYAMMDKIQAGRKKTVGKGNVAKDTKAKKHLLA